MTHLITYSIQAAFGKTADDVVLDINQLVQANNLASEWGGITRVSKRIAGSFSAQMTASLAKLIAKLPSVKHIETAPPPTYFQPKP